MDLTNLDYRLPIDISTHGSAIDQLIHGLHWFMLVLFVGWGAYLIYCLIAFRQRAGHVADVRARTFSLPKYLEIGVVLVEVVFLVFLSIPLWAKYKNEFPPESESLVVRITAEQFAWNIHYPGPDGKFGLLKQELMDGTNPVGLDRNDPAGKDDVLSINQFYVPVNKPVIVHLMSKDVIHSFFLPVARVKQDAIPGMEIPVWFEVTQEGEYEIACAQLCGIGHYRMRGFFNVLSQDKFDLWMAEEQKSLLAGVENLVQSNEGEVKS